MRTGCALTDEQEVEREGQNPGGVCTIREAVEEAAKRLGAAGVEEPRTDARLLLAHLRSVDRATLLADAREPLGHDELASFRQLVDRRVAREPVAQIIGRKEFWSLDFQITADVLCPRPDSECVVEAALKEVRWLASRLGGNRQRGWEGRILDLGTGSGCLLLALLSELPAASGIGVDISMQALSVARSNGERLGLETQASWLCGDWGASIEGRFDLIVSNPPYVTLDAAAELAPEVREFEPGTALFAGKDGLDAYRALRHDLNRLLAPEGAVLLELGEGQAAEVEALFLASGFRSVRRQQDLAGIDRCLILKRE
jgi:release factor glutamine methyltransferase